MSTTGPILTSKPLPFDPDEVELFPQQANFAMLDDYKFKLFSGGVGTGKSRFAGSYYMIRRAFQNPETLYVLGANSYKQLNQATLRAFFATLKKHHIRFVVNRKPPAAWGVDKEWESHHGILTLENGAQMLLWSFDRYDLIEGIEIGGFWIDETRKTKEGAWLYLVERLRCPLSHFLHGRVTTTPGGRAHWLFKEFQKDPRFYKIIYMATTENTELPTEYLDHLFSSIDPLLLAQELGGRYIDLQQGKTYYCWDSQVNGQLVWPYDPLRPLVFALDFNILSKSPISCVIGQEHYNFDLGIWQLQVIDEIVLPFGDTQKASNEFLNRYRNHPGEVHVYGDASGEFRTVSEFKVIRDALVPTFRDRLKFPDTGRRANPLVNERVTSVNQAFLNGKMQVRLFVDAKKCPRLVADLAEVENKPGGGIEKRDPLLTHSSDALGYWVYVRLPSIHAQKRRAVKGNA